MQLLQPSLLPAAADIARHRHREPYATVVLTGVAPSGAPAVARRNVLPRPGEMDQAYAEPQQQYYYQQPQYAQPQYGQRYGYGSPNPYYAQQEPQHQYAQPRYAQPAPARDYRYRDPYYRDPYADIPPPPRPRTLFPF